MNPKDVSFDASVYHVIQLPFQPRILETARSIYCRFPVLSTDEIKGWCSREEIRFLPKAVENHSS
jgi:hypothetical protein